MIAEARDTACRARTLNIYSSVRLVVNLHLKAAVLGVVVAVLGKLPREELDSSRHELAPVLRSTHGMTLGPPHLELPPPVAEETFHALALAQQPQHVHQQGVP
jgi:hypothetical protein